MYLHIPVFTGFRTQIIILVSAELKAWSLCVGYDVLCSDGDVAQEEVWNCAYGQCYVVLVLAVPSL